MIASVCGVVRESEFVDCLGDIPATLALIFIEFPSASFSFVSFAFPSACNESSRRSISVASSSLRMLWMTPERDVVSFVCCPSSPLVPLRRLIRSDGSINGIVRSLGQRFSRVSDCCGEDEKCVRSL